MAPMQVQDIFLAAIEIADLQQRADYVATACGGDEALHQKIRALLAAHERSGGFLDMPALQQMAATRAHDELGQQREVISEDIELSFLEPSTTPKSLGRLQHYDVQAVIGQGGCGIVLKAFDAKLHRIVAIKIMSPQLAATSPARKRFLREARATAAIHHENVVSIYVVEEKPLPFLVMEYIDGMTLQDEITRTGPLELSAILSIGQDIARGLEVAHDKGLVHRDIKPANVLLERGTGRVKITDFGLARSADDASLTQSGAISGTPLYMSPEQAQGLKIDRRSDLFSLGSVLYVMCTGRPPFRAGTSVAVLKRVVEDTPRPIREIIPETPEWLISIIAKLHAKNPEERYSSAREVIEAIERRETKQPVHETALPVSAGVLEEPDSRGDHLQRLVAALKRPAWANSFLVILIVMSGLGRVLIGPWMAAKDLAAPDGRELTLMREQPPESDGELASERPDQPPAVDLQSTSDRKAAEYVLSIGGKIQINQVPQDLTSLQDLPKADFQLTSVTLLNNSQVSEERLSVFAETQQLRRLELGGVRELTDAGLAHFGNNRQLSYLGLGSTRVSGTGFRFLRECSALKVLWMNSPAVSDEGLAAIAELREISTLGLIDCPVSDQGVAQFANHPNLRQVELPGTKITDATLQTALTWPKLGRLHVDRTEITDEGLSILKGRHTLEDLALSGTRISDTGIHQLTALVHLKNLNLVRTRVSETGVKKLAAAIRNCRIAWNGGVIEPSSSADFLAASYVLSVGGSIQVNNDDHVVRSESRFPSGPFQITTVNLNACPKVTDEGLSVFDDCIGVVALDVSRTPIRNQGLEHFRKCRNLKSLICNDSNVIGTALKQFEECQHLEELQLYNIPLHMKDLAPLADRRYRRLNLGSTGIVDEWLSRFTNLEDLEFLDLSLSDVGDQGLSHLRRSPKLKSLNLRQTRVTDAGLSWIDGFAELEQLDLSETAVTDAGIGHLKDLKKLKHLNIMRTKVTASGIDDLKRSRPECEITWIDGVGTPE